MNRQNYAQVGVARDALALMAALTLLVSIGCRAQRHHAEEQASTSDQGQSVSGPDIDLNCIIDHIQNPTDSFHYVYKKSGIVPVEEEADITPQSMDGSFRNGDFTRPVHGVRSDADGWHTAWAGMTGIAGMSSTIALVNHGSALVREGNEKVNGYDTIKYSIDTARGNTAEQMLYKITLGSGGSEKGEVWVTSQGCPVKLSLDEEMHLHDGSVNKVHYEEAMVRK
jgi:hypothetical protein